MANHVGERAAYDMAVAFAQTIGGVVYHQLIANKRLLGRHPCVDPFAVGPKTPR